MQEHGASSMNLVGSDVPFLWSASWDKRNGRKTVDPMVVSTVWADEQVALKRAQQAHAQSLMMLVHELRSPIAASKSMVATLRYLNPQDTQLDSFLAKIENRMDQLLDLVNDILDLSQAKAGRPFGQAATLDLVAETEAVCKPYLEEATTKGLVMSVELPQSPVRMHMPQKAYRLIVSNLVSNAVKYTPTGSIRVNLRKKGAWAVLTVQDTGIGIPSAEICDLFTEFFRASNARKGRTPGTGLGLAAVKALAEGYNGKLELQSQENTGSRFTVRLPLCRADAAHEAKSRLHATRRVQ
jgi:signal transduction histidine kinase